MIDMEDVALAHSYAQVSMFIRRRHVAGGGRLALHVSRDT